MGKVVTAILGIVSIKYITNYLSPSTYGEYTTIYDYTALFAIIADFGLFTIAVREMAYDNRKEMIQKIVGNVLSLRTILAIISLGLGVLVAALIPAYQNSHIPCGVLIVSIATIITLIAGTMSSVLQFYLRMHWASIGLSVGKLVTVAYIVLTITYIFPHSPNLGFPHLLFAWIMGGLVTILITLVASRKLVPISFQFDFRFWKNVLVKALPYGMALVLGTIYFRMGTIVLSLFKMKEQAGFYGVPLRFLEILQIIPHYFMNSVLPILTISLKIGSDRVKRIIKYSLNALACLSFPTLVGGYLLAWPITAAVSSPQFLTQKIDGHIFWGSDMALKILLVAMCFTYVHVVFNYVLVAMNRQFELLWANGIVVIVNITLNLILAPRYGFIGSAISSVCSELTMFVVLGVRVRRYIKGFWDPLFFAKTAFSALLMGVVLYFSADYFNRLLFAKSLFVLIPLGGVIFAAGMFMTRAFSKELLALLKKTEPPVEES